MNRVIKQFLRRSGGGRRQFSHALKITKYWAVLWSVFGFLKWREKKVSVKGFTSQK